MATLYQHGQALQGVVGDLSTLATRDLTRLFDRYSESDVFDELVRRGVPELVRPYVEASGTVTARWYDQLAAGTGGTDYRAQVFADIPGDRVARSVDWAMNAPGDATPLDRLAGSTSRMIADASRQTVIGNVRREKVRWARVASPGACVFCAMLVGRGPVYHSEDAALASHDHCRCLAVPVRDMAQWSDDELPDFAQDYRDEYYDAVAAADDGSTAEIQAAMRSARKAAAGDADTVAWLDAGAEHAAAVRYYAQVDSELASAMGAAPADAAPVSALDRKLADANAALDAGQYERADALLVEADQLERAEQAAARRAAASDAAEAAKTDRVLELIEQGWAPDEAQAEAFGKTVERVRRDEFIREARSQGHKGRGFDELLTEMHVERAAEDFWRAEDATHGFMLKRKYDGKIDPRKLWTVNEATARKWMSDEMAEWFDANGRLTRAALRDAVLAGRGAWRNPMVGDFLQ